MPTAAEPIGPDLTATPNGDEWLVYAKRGLKLGVVAWYGRRRRFGFVPGVPVAYNADHMRAIADFLDRVTAARKAGGGA